MSHHRTGLELVNRITEYCEALGVTLLTSTRANKIFRDANGKICAVGASCGDGSEIMLYAKSVVIATGSMSANKELLRRFFPDSEYDKVKIMAAMPYSTGEGLIMAEEVGAAVGKISPNYIGPHNHPRNVLVGCLLRRPHMMIVNRLGERYIAEDIFGRGEFGWMSGKALEQQPGRICYPIMDEACFRDMIAHKTVASEVEGNQSRHDTKTGLLMEDVSPTAWLDSVEDRLPKEVEDKMLKICGSLDEVAAWIGCDIGVLNETVSRYNGYCFNNYDDDFLKDPQFLYPVKQPPFYVFKGLHGIDNFIGGIKINHNMEVTDENCLPIPGLFAAGIATSGWLGQGYGHAGTEMGLTTFSGYCAGTAAAAFAAKSAK